MVWFEDAIGVRWSLVTSLDWLSLVQCTFESLELFLILLILLIFFSHLFIEDSPLKVLHFGGFFHIARNKDETSRAQWKDEQRENEKT